MTDEELNEAVAGRIFGYMQIPNTTFFDSDGARNVIIGFEPANDIESAFRVVEKMRERGWSVEIENGKSVLNAWSVLFSHGEKEVEREEWDESLPRAICVTALKAIEAAK